MEERRAACGNLIDDPASVSRQVRRLVKSDLVLSRLRFVGIANAGGGDLPIIGEGVEPDAENRLGTFVRLVNGRMLRKRFRRRATDKWIGVGKSRSH